MAVKVITPNDKYNQKYAGVQFERGVGIFEDEDKGKKIAKFLGYKVVAIGKAEPKVEAKVEPKAEEPAKAEPKPKRRSATRRTKKAD